MAILDDGLQRNTHFVLEGAADRSLKRLLCLHLLVEDPKGNVLEIGNGWDFFVEKNLLSYDVDQKPFFAILSFDFFELVLNTLSKTKFFLLAHGIEVAIFIFG